MTQNSVDFVGTGFRFPMRIEGGGRWELETGHEKIISSLRMILSTAPGERVLRPEFGCAIWSQIFDPVDSNTLSQMESNVREAIAQWEPRIVLESVDPRPAEEQPNLVEIEIAYRIRDTNDTRNLVYPFYVIPGE